MSINIDMTGSGTLGPIEPGWTVQEAATPSTLGGSASTSGTASISAATRDDSLLAINNYITTTDDELGTISGIVKSVSQNGLSTSITHSSAFAKYDAEKNIPGLISNKFYSGLDLITQLSKNEIRLKSGLSGYFWSLQGHNEGFDSSGNIAERSEYANLNGFIWYDMNGVLRNNYWAIANNNASTNVCRFLSNNKQYAGIVYCENFSTDVNSRYNTIAFKTLNEATDSTSNVSLSWGTMRQYSYSGSLKYSSFTLDKPNKQLYVNIDYVAAGLQQKFEDYVNLSSLDWNKEMSVFFEFTSSDGIFYVGEGYKYSYKVTICNSDNYANTVVYTKTIGVDFFALWHDVFNFQRGPNSYAVTSSGAALGVRSLWIRKDNTPVIIQDWENDRKFTVSQRYLQNNMVLSASNSLCVIPVKQNMWQWLQDMATSGRELELCIINDVLHLRAIGESVIDISNISSPPSITPNSTLTGKSVAINYTNALHYMTGLHPTSESRAEVYNAYEDNNRILTVNIGEIIKTTVETDYYVESVISPNITSTIPAGRGSYNVTDSAGFPVNSGWYGAGGRVFVTKNKDNPYAIDIEVVGPAAAYGGYTAPYSIALKASDKNYASLRIIGSGYKVDKKTLNLQTGATPEKTPTDIAKTIDNVWMSNRTIAFDAGISASIDASGPRVTLSGTIPTSSISGFGLTPGSIISYKDSKYRIESCTVGNVSTSFEAVRYVNVEDFDAIWNGSTVSQHDTVWANSEASDQIIVPLYKPV